MKHVIIWKQRGLNRWAWDCMHPGCPATGWGGFTDTHAAALTQAWDHIDQYAPEVVEWEQAHAAGEAP